MQENVIGHENNTFDL